MQVFAFSHVQHKCLSPTGFTGTPSHNVSVAPHPLWYTSKQGNVPELPIPFTRKMLQCLHQELLGAFSDLQVVLHRMRLNVAYSRHFWFKLQQALLCPFCEKHNDLKGNLIRVCMLLSDPIMSLIVSFGQPLCVRLQPSDVLILWSKPESASHVSKVLLTFLQSTALDHRP